MDDLWTRTHHISEAALASGALQPIATENLAVEEAGIPFTLRILSSLADKAQARKRLARASRQQDNPFLPPDPALLVAEVPPAHRCVLNKFCVIRDHLLLVTRDFEPQQQALNAADLAALAGCLAEGPALAFYNSAPEAGASQPHKHLQLVPLGAALRLPFAPLLERAAAEGLASVPELRFPHRLATLPEGLLSRPEEAAEWLHHRYRALLAALGLEVAPNGCIAHPYNLLLTAQWLLLVPRRRERAAGVSINALGFAGALLVKSRPEAEALISRGLMNCLAAVVSGLP
ncbi:phosphorylase [Billgrantia azerbaijanica]|nr:phosphorylase [Halomonas azerbaijanica]